MKLILFKFNWLFYHYRDSSVSKWLVLSHFLPYPKAWGLSCSFLASLWLFLRVNWPPSHLPNLPIHHPMDQNCGHTDGLPSCVWPDVVTERTSGSKSHICIITSAIWLDATKLIIIDTPPATMNARTSVSFILLNLAPR